MKHPHPSINNIAFILFQCEQLNWLSKLTTAVKTMRGCATFREVAWIFTRQGHLNQVKRTDFVNEELDKAMLKTWRRAALIARTIWPFVSQIRPVWPRGIWIRGNWLVFVYNQLYLLYLHVFVFFSCPISSIPTYLTDWVLIISLSDRRGNARVSNPFTRISNGCAEVQVWYSREIDTWPPCRGSHRAGAV